MHPRAALLLVALTLALSTHAAVAAPAVAVIEDAPWSPGDAPREGAAELGVLLQLALLQRDAAVVGLVGVGDHRGIFLDGTQRGLEFAVRQGVPVVRLARRAPVSPPAESDLLINGGMLAPDAAVALLAECLERYGSLPRVRQPTAPTERELSALRSKLRLYQAEFNARQPALVAMR